MAMVPEWRRRLQRDSAGRTPIYGPNGKIVGWSDTRGAGTKSSSATDVSSSKGRGYGPKYKVTVMDLMAAHKKKNFKYVQRFLPTLPAASRALYQRRKAAWDARMDGDKAGASSPGAPAAKPGAPAAKPGAVKPAAGGGRVSKAQGRRKAGGAVRSVFAGAFGLPNVRGGSFIDEARLQRGFDPMADEFAGLLAGSEFDPAIREVEREIARNPETAAQNLHNIKTWNDQVMGHQAAAAAANKAAHAAGLSEMQGASQSILESLGGGANPGAGMIGAAGINALSAQRAQGAAEEAYQANVAPLLAAEAASRSRDEQTRMSNEARDLSARLTGLRRERGGAKAQRLFDIRQYNNQLAQQAGEAYMRGRQFNNAIREANFQQKMSRQQQAFQNALALQEADIAAQSMGIDRQAAGLDRWLKRIEGKQALAELRGSESDPSKNPNYYKNFANLDAGKLNELQANFLNSIRRDESGAPVGMPAANPNNWSVPLVNQYLRGLGFKPRGNKRVGRFARSLAEQLTGKAISKKNARKYWGV